ncbi:hypothetical protein EDEG_02182 [Edhazardia aedis USNM 41457]|uniref:Uncharacterized protein n=1 Tax=Edhazardia aedis (strain USNM 41457) TaxID=1003232 RepID=J9D6T1_EDHAE|nr:hypothetical protein EDEG_02182 [Edhazardia aedis USNM 41457]|eukprot:EJW03486.1 hypothetical protein EDEG_02182 [Edhazardia aedis USNM 41457]
MFRSIYRFFFKKHWDIIGTFFIGIFVFLFFTWQDISGGKNIVEPTSTIKLSRYHEHLIDFCNDQGIYKNQVYNSSNPDPYFFAYYYQAREINNASENEQSSFVDYETLSLPNAENDQEDTEEQKLSKQQKLLIRKRNKKLHEIKYYLKSMIEGRDFTIFDTIPIADLFEILYDEKRYEGGFLYRGVLFKMAHEFYVQKLTSDVSRPVLGVRNFWVARKYGSDFFDMYLYFSDFVDHSSSYSKNIRKSDEFSCAELDGHTKHENIINTKRNALEENLVFVRKLNIWIQLQWDVFFGNLEQFYKIQNPNISNKILNQNKNELQTYDISSFETSVLWKREMEINDAGNKAFIIVISTDRLNRRFLDEITAHIPELINNHFKSSENQIDFEKLFKTEGDKKILTEYAIEKLDLLSLLVRYSLSNQTLN